MTMFYLLQDTNTVGPVGSLKSLFTSQTVAGLRQSVVSVITSQKAVACRFIMVSNLLDMLLSMDWFKGKSTGT